MSKAITSCPNCSHDISKEELGTGAKYKNENAIVIYECPHCNDNYKVDIYQYDTWKSGKLDRIDSFKEYEKTPGDKAAGLGLWPYLILIAIAIFFII